MNDSISPDFAEYTDRTREVWDRLAEWWDDRIGDGNPTQELLLEPNTERMLELQPGERVLDIACGAGRFARRMAALGAEVVAFDHSDRFIARARQRTTEYADRIDYRVIQRIRPGRAPVPGQGPVRRRRSAQWALWTWRPLSRFYPRCPRCSSPALGSCSPLRTPSSTPAACAGLRRSRTRTASW